jgi:hypothetical protein
VSLVGQLLEQRMGANKRLDQAVVANSVGRIFGIDYDGTIANSVGPRNPDVLCRAILL